MSVRIKMYWEGIKPEQYEKIHAASNYDTNIPKGAIFHTAAFSDEGMHVVDMWESAEDFNAFVEARLKPIVKTLGIKEQPQVEISTVYRASFPGYTEKLRKELKSA